MRCGLYGKLPSKRDFVAIGTPRALLDVWEPWMQGGISASRQSLGDDWKQAFLTAPIWRFWLGAELCGTTVLGAFMPSLDGVGRYFPLTLFACPNERRARSRRPSSTRRTPGSRAAEEFLLATLEQDATFESRDRRPRADRRAVRRQSACRAATTRSRCRARWRRRSHERALPEVFAVAAARGSRQRLRRRDVLVDGRRRGLSAARDERAAHARPIPVRRDADRPIRFRIRLMFNAALMHGSVLGFDSGAATHVGKVRRRNEDGYLVRPEVGLWAVADGMGGLEAGDLASRTVIDALKSIGQPSSAAELLAWCEQRVVTANSRPERHRAAPRRHHRNDDRGPARLRLALCLRLVRRQPHLSGARPRDDPAVARPHGGAGARSPRGG